MIAIDEKEIVKEKESSAKPQEMGEKFSIWKDIQQVFHLLASSIDTRTQLFLLEIEELIEALIKSIAALFFLALLSVFFIFSLNLAVIAYFWETHRNEAAVGTVIFFLLLMGVTVVYWRKQKPLHSFCKETINQLKKDIGELKGYKNE